MLSALFLHLGPLHLIVNLCARFVIGPGLERIISSVRFARDYLLPGLGSLTRALIWRPHRLLHADLPHLYGNPDVAGRPRAAPGNGLQSLVDLGAIRAPPFSSSRSRALEPDEPQPRPHAPTLPPGPACRGRAGQEFPP